MFVVVVKLLGSCFFLELLGKGRSGLPCKGSTKTKQPDEEQPEGLCGALLLRSRAIAQIEK